MTANYSQDITPTEVQQKMAAKESIHIIDVREMHEWEAGHIQGAKHIPLGSLTERLHELDRKKAYVIVCHLGGRSGLACEYLEELGYNVANMVGGMQSWHGEVEYGE